MPSGQVALGGLRRTAGTCTTTGSTTSPPRLPPTPKAPARSARLIGDFSFGHDTNRLEQTGLKPLDADLARIASISSAEDGVRLVADLHWGRRRPVRSPPWFPDPKNSSVYAVILWQAGLGLPDRDYHLMGRVFRSSIGTALMSARCRSAARRGC